MIIHWNRWPTIWAFFKIYPAYFSVRHLGCNRLATIFIITILDCFCKTYYSVDVKIWLIYVLQPNIGIYMRLYCPSLDQAGMLSCSIISN
jgi:hypothetical protein